MGARFGTLDLMVAHFARHLDWVRGYVPTRVATQNIKSIEVISIIHGADNEKKTPQPTWTSLDLLGNKGKRNRRGSDSSPKPTQENLQVTEDDQLTRLYKIC